MVRAYRDGPVNGSPVVLIHAFLATSAAWAANVAALAEHHPVYTLDALGQAGASVQTVPIRSTADQVAWLGECFGALALDRVHLVGWSYGGWMSLHHALLASQRSATLTLVEPANTLARTPVVGFYRRMFALPVVTRLPGAYFDSLVDRYLAWMLTGPDPDNPALARYREIPELLRAACSAYVPTGREVLVGWCLEFYNVRRRHSSAGLQPPANYEQTAADNRWQRKASGRPVPLGDRRTTRGHAV
jgi:pimeloyl-ACP methyl ester carboxylesterase